jgi:putative tryptophan/tyrosine transport system substrate-binding protein
MKRREFIGGFGGATAWSFAARAQVPAMSAIAGRAPRSRDTDPRLDTALAATRLELLHELVPKAVTIAALVNPNVPDEERQLGHAQDAASKIGVRLLVLNTGTESDIDNAFAELVQQRASGLLIGADPFINSQLDKIVALAARDAVPTMYVQRDFVAAGGLMSYGLRRRGVRRDVGVNNAGISTPGQTSGLLVIQAANIELVINLKTAKLLGLEVPPALLARADEVIE